MRQSDLSEAARIRADLCSGTARQQRTAAGITAADMARVLRVTPQAVSSWETGRRVPSTRHALAYGRALARHRAKKASGVSPPSENHFPVPIPDEVKDWARLIFKPDPADILSRPAPMFGGKSAVWWVADSDGTWGDVIAKYETMLSYQVTQ